MNPTSSPQSVLGHHLDGIRQSDVAAILADYVEQSVFHTPDGPRARARGHQAVFHGLLRQYSATFIPQFKILRQEITGDIAYIVWRSGGALQGTDTFVIRDGKIAIQTFAAYVPA